MQNYLVRTSSQCTLPFRTDTFTNREMQFVGLVRTYYFGRRTDCENCSKNTIKMQIKETMDIPLYPMGYLQATQTTTNGA